MAVPTAICAMVCLGAFSSSFVLDCFCVDASGMARACCVYAGNAFGRMALGRAGVVFGRWVSFLAAGYSTLAARIDGAAMVDPFVPLSCYLAVRHSIRISCVLCPCGLH